MKTLDVAARLGAREVRLAEARSMLADRLRSRLPEMEAATLARVYAIQDPLERSDPHYVQGLHASLGTALNYAIATVEQGEERIPEVPASLLAQARMAARCGVALDVVLRRYFTGYSLVTEFVIEEAEKAGLTADSLLHRQIQGQATVFDRLIEAVTEQHRLESAKRFASTEDRKIDRVKRLLQGEQISAAELNYEMQKVHVAIVARGSVGDALRGLAARLGTRLLMVRPHEGLVWAWLGAQEGIDAEGEDRLTEAVGAFIPDGSAAVIGEPGEGLEGWRRSHRQAQAALPLLQTAETRVVRYRDVALVAAMLNDQLLASSLRQLYLEPLEAVRGGGETARETLRAYFALDRNVSSTAAALGIRRHTVTNRLRSIEHRLGRPLGECGVELEALLRLEELSSSRTVTRTGRDHNGRSEPQP
jgi:hypothetical protein